MKQSFSEGFIKPKKDGGKIPYLNATATDSEVVTGKTYYNTDVNTKRTGTGANAKRVNSGVATGVSTVTVTGLPYTPTKVTITSINVTGYYCVGVILSNPQTLYINNGASYGIKFTQTTGGVNAVSGQGANYITADGFSFSFGALTGDYYWSVEE